MKPIPKILKERLIKNHFDNLKSEQRGEKSFKVVLKLFNPTGIGTWYLTELDPVNNVAFGLCCLHEKVIGFVSLDELSEFKGRFGLGIERDKYFSINKYSLKECKQLWLYLEEQL